MSTYPTRVSVHPSQKAAETAARKFDKARAFNGFKLLYVEQTGEQEWTVFNPGYSVERTPVSRRDPVSKE